MGGPLTVTAIGGGVGGASHTTTNPTTANSVIELTDADFDAAVAAHPRLLVNFYAPWCPTCVNFKEDYEKAAASADQSGLGVRFAKVNSDEHRMLVKRFQVRAHYVDVFVHS